MARKIRGRFMQEKSTGTTKMELLYHARQSTHIVKLPNPDKVELPSIP